MWDFLKEIYLSAEKSGFQPELILLVGLIAFAVYVFYFFKKQNIVMMETISKVAASNASIATLIKDESDNIEKESMILSELSNNVAGLTFKIEHLKDADERLTEQQAIIVYNLIIGEIFSDIREAYYSSKDWIRDKDPDDPLIERRLSDRITIIFESLHADVVNKLSNFKYKDEYLKLYVNEGFKSEMTQVKVFIYDSLMSDSNGIREYLKNKHETFSSDFQIYLRSRHGN